jgi:phage gp36-like protein
MPYCTKALLEASLGVDVVAEIYDDDGLGGADEGPLARVFADVDAVIDAKLSGAYDTPFPTSPVPPVIQGIANLLAMAYSQQRHSEYVRVDGDAMRTEAMDLMEQLKAGDMQIPGVPRRNDGALVGSGTGTSTGAARQPGPKMFGDGLGSFNGEWPPR